MTAGIRHPLTCGQRWLAYVLQQSPALARPVQRIYRLRTDVDTSAVLCSFRHLVSSHPALRTRLVRSGREWKQTFPALKAAISGVEVRDGSRRQRAAYARYLIAQESAHPFDLHTEPPFQIKIVRVDRNQFLSLCVDHIAADDLALDVLEREWTSAYLREVGNRPHLAAGEEKVFLDYLSRESAQRRNEAMNLDYWRRHLLGAPFGRHKEEGITWVGGENHQWQIAGERFQRLLSACKAASCSLFAAVLGAQVKMLAELEKTDEVVVNVPVSNRSRAEDHNIIGNLSMLLHLRFRVEHRAPPAVFLHQIRNQILQAMVHRQYDYASLSRLVAADAATRGGTTHWLTGCSYIIERGPLTGGGPLFLERLDNQPSRAIQCLKTSFSIAYRQGDSRLHCAADWDPATWQIHGRNLEQLYISILDSFLDTGPHDKVV
jgi:hypothetical protein